MDHMIMFVHPNKKVVPLADTAAMIGNINVSTNISTATQTFQLQRKHFNKCLNCDITPPLLVGQVGVATNEHKAGPDDANHCLHSRLVFFPFCPTNIYMFILGSFGDNVI
jgi:hypothetical protein